MTIHSAQHSKGPSGTRVLFVGAGICAIAFFVFGALAFVAPAAPAFAATCDASVDLVSRSGEAFNPFVQQRIGVAQGQAAIDVRNRSHDCTYDINLAAYKVFSPLGNSPHTEYIRTQELATSQTLTIHPGELLNLHIPVPSCNYQVDLFTGTTVPQNNPDFGNPPLSNTHRLFDWVQTFDRGLCGSMPPPPPPPSCVPHRSVDITVTPISVNNSGRASAVVTNHSALCSYNVSMVSYKTGDWTPNNRDGFLQSQVLFDSNVRRTLLPGQSADLSVAVPSCNYQVDVLEWDDSTDATPDNGYILDRGHGNQYWLFTWLVKSTIGSCFVTPSPARLTLIKTVINNNGGTAQVSDFPLFVNSTQVSSGVANTFAPGTYVASETNRTGYTAGAWTGDCAANGSVTLLAGDTKVCRITNDDTPIVTSPTRLTLIKTVINDNGGTAVVSDFPLYVENRNVQSGISTVLTPGTYSVHELSRSDYVAGVWTGDCSPTGSITLVVGDNKVCRITNNDIPHTPSPARLTLIKTVINNNGGTAQVSDFPLFVNSTQVSSGVANTFAPGTYVASETNRTGYTAGAWTGDCAANGSVTLLAGDTKVCRITNDDVGGGGGDESTLVLIKNVINDNGGSARPSDFPLYVSNVRVSTGQINTLSPSTYVAREDNLPGYTAGTWGGDCASDGTVTLTTGDHKTCTITNNDNGVPGCPNCGGGDFPPRVVLFGHPESNPLVASSFIYLSQLPYTGLGINIAQALAFLFMLVVLTGAVTYGLLTCGVWMRLRYAFNAFFDASRTATEDTTPPVTPTSFRHPHTTVSAPESILSVSVPIEGALPLMHNRQETVPDVAENRHVATPATMMVSNGALLDTAREHRVLISDDGLALIARAAEGKTEKGLAILATVIEHAKTRYPREDGWLILDKQRTKEGLFGSILSAVPLFVEWMMRNEDKKVFDFLRTIRQQEQPVGAFIRKVIADLDTVYRTRLEGIAEHGAVDQHLVEVTQRLSNKELESVITELLRGIDESYGSPFTSVKLAVARMCTLSAERSRSQGGRYAFDDTGGSRV